LTDLGIVKEGPNKGQLENIVVNTTQSTVAFKISSSNAKINENIESYVQG
tara:strand:+ start:188 stop:337 length:150 start_codon:yes stop_codon:yes gene_type:complete